MIADSSVKALYSLGGAVASSEKSDRLTYVPRPGQPGLQVAAHILRGHLGFGCLVGGYKDSHLRHVAPVSGSPPI